MTNGKFENNPFYLQKHQIRFDKVYSEKDFKKDCWHIQGIANKNLLTREQIDLVVYFWIGQLKPVDRNIKKIAKETVKYMFFLRKVAKRDAQIK